MRPSPAIKKAGGFLPKAATLVLLQSFPLSHHPNGGHVAPLADLRVVVAVDALVSPHRARAAGGSGETFNGLLFQQH
jgi:hypothetical protein